ncbi:MAG: aldo/keto reductase [Acidobacteriota bacterium]|jgi:aryl-alcohol dehydrogenase-like predicted oxidoreductase|nr:aldo/keto reductase [Bryobacteraceae bacterium CoA2 C42]MCA2966844.1 aldo/keto reductase [Acidobacteriaceae bacterium]
MQKRQLGNSDLMITPLGVGAWAIGGGGWAFGWGPQDDAESVGAIRAALDAGMNWVDTAAVYGLGHSEEVVARALDGLANRPYVFTKCGRVWDENRVIGKRLKRDSVRAECEASLRRLRVDVIDLYQMHWPEPDEDVEEGWTAMAELQAEGKVRWIGVSNFSKAQMERAQKIAPITSLQPPYSLLTREVEAEVLPHAAATGIGAIVYSPMGRGLLTGAMTRERIAAMPEDDHRKRWVQFQEPTLTKNLELVEKLREIGERYGVAPGEVALAWVLRRPEVTGAIAGLRSAAQLEGVIQAMEYRLTPGEEDEISFYL